MPDLQVIYDSSVEVAAIVDLDTNMGWGPMCPGPQGGELLQSFVDGMPFDLTILSGEQARDIFLSVFREQAAESIANAGKGNPPQVEHIGDSLATDTAQATAEAVAAAGAPPEPAPHDADMEADPSQTSAVTSDPTVPDTQTGTGSVGTLASSATSTMTNCLICNAQGTGSNNPACPVCGGSGQVQAA